MLEEAQESRAVEQGLREQFEGARQRILCRARLDDPGQQVACFQFRRLSRALSGFPEPEVQAKTVYILAPLRDYPNRPEPIR